jgi:hypothetical protein
MAVTSVIKIFTMDAKEAKRIAVKEAVAACRLRKKKELERPGLIISEHGVHKCYCTDILSN